METTITDFLSRPEIMPFVKVAPWVLALLVVWSIVWKGMALWKAARRESKGWFIVLLLVNTLGILEILYIFFFSKEKGVKTESQM